MNKEKFAKIGKGLLISMGAAGVTYLLGSLDVIDVDIYTPMVVAVIGSLLNAAKVYLQKMEVK